MVGIINVWISLGGGGEAVSFAYDGATFTPGEYVENSGERSVTVELTLDSASITSGTIWVACGAMMSSDFSLPLYNDDTGDLQVYSLDDTGSLGLWLRRSAISDNYLSLLTVPSSEGKCEFSFTLGNDAAEEINGYAVVLLPSGGVAVSDAIAVPPYVE